jgi:CCR4-NOT transcriptional regulation complex NOT5 subunit
MGTIEDLERRIEQLEEQVARALPAKIDAVAYLLSVVHEESRATRQTLDSHSQMLQEILRRLPASEG